MRTMGAVLQRNSLPKKARPTEPYDYADAKAAGHKIAQARRIAVRELEEATLAAAEAEWKYHAVKTEKIAELRANEVGITEIQERIKGENDVNALLYEREKAKYLVLIAQEKLHSIDGERATFHRLVEWSMQVERTMPT